jgi:hypothetical protein
MENVESVPRLTPLRSCQTRYTSFRSISDSDRRRSPVARPFVTLISQRGPPLFQSYSQVKVSACSPPSFRLRKTDTAPIGGLTT